MILALLLDDKNKVIRKKPIDYYVAGNGYVQVSTTEIDGYKSFMHPFAELVLKQAGDTAYFKDGNVVDSSGDVVDIMYTPAFDEIKPLSTTQKISYGLMLKSHIPSTQVSSKYNIIYDDIRDQLSFLSSKSIDKLCVNTKSSNTLFVITNKSEIDEIVENTAKISADLGTLTTAISKAVNGNELQEFDELLDSLDKKYL